MRNRICPRLRREPTPASGGPIEPWNSAPAIGNVWQIWAVPAPPVFDDGLSALGVHPPIRQAARQPHHRERCRAAAAPPSPSRRLASTPPRPQRAQHTVLRPDTSRRAQLVVLERERAYPLARRREDSVQHRRRGNRRSSARQPRPRTHRTASLDRFYLGHIDTSASAGRCRSSAVRWRRPSRCTRRTALPTAHRRTSPRPAPSPAAG